ncbi:MAG: SIS domain-containing protein [Planctomycetes bacterium]|nr:SIS domain-containing protein [Planctomycetota bacterium]
MRGILKDLQRILEAVPEAETRGFVEAIRDANRVFMYGLGRSGLVARMFGMRLVQLDRDATIVGDTTTPAIRKGDLLIQCSRTGRSPILHHIVKLAHREKARVAAVVGRPEVLKADLVVRLPLEAAKSETAQPMGSLFEQALLLYLDHVVLLLMAELNKTVEDMERIHSNLP